MSILEEIKEAERVAAEAKRDTIMTAREMMREAEEDEICFLFLPLGMQNVYSAMQIKFL